MSFWDHLEVLRGTLFRSVLVITLVSVVVFCFKSLVFDDIILAPTKSDFFIYKWLRMGNMQMSLVILEISAQFWLHPVFPVCLFRDLEIHSPSSLQE